MNWKTNSNGSLSQLHPKILDKDIQVLKENWDSNHSIKQNPGRENKISGLKTNKQSSSR